MNHRNDPQTMSIAQAIQGTLSQAGIKVELTAMTGKQSLGAYRAREPDLYLGAWGPGYPDPNTHAEQIGSASGRESVSQIESVYVVAVTFTINTHAQRQQPNTKQTKLK